MKNFSETTAEKSKTLIWVKSRLKGTLIYDLSGKINEHKKINTHFTMTKVIECKAFSTVNVIGYCSQANNQFDFIIFIMNIMKYKCYYYNKIHILCNLF